MSIVLRIDSAYKPSFFFPADSNYQAAWRMCPTSQLITYETFLAAIVLQMMTFFKWKKLRNSTFTPKRLYGPESPATKSADIGEMRITQSNPT